MADTDPESCRYFCARVLPGVRRIKYPKGEEARRSIAGFQLPVLVPFHQRGLKSLLWSSTDMTSLTISRRQTLSLAGAGAATTAVPAVALSASTSEANDAELMRLYSEFRRLDSLANAADNHTWETWRKDEALIAESERLDALMVEALSRFSAAPAKTLYGILLKLRVADEGANFSEGDLNHGLVLAAMVDLKTMVEGAGGGVPPLA